MKVSLMEMLIEYMNRHGENSDDILYMNQYQNTMQAEFRNSHGSTNKPPYCLVWTAKSVYFSEDYDGIIGIERVPRNPPM